MSKMYQTLFASQFEAAFLTLKNCIDSCPDEAWAQPVCNHKFCQAAFHALFFADVYLGPNPTAVEDQDFHREHSNTFAGYEEWEKKKPEKTYSREFIGAYLEHCRAKAAELMATCSDEDLAADSGFDWIKGPAAEVHVYNIRHLQHHAAQMSLRLRLNKQAEIGWVRGGWPE